MNATIIPVPGRDYEVTGSVVFEHEGKVQNGVAFMSDGLAYAGRVVSGPRGEFIAWAFTPDDEMIEAHPDWASMIVREIRTSAAATSAAA